MFGSAAITLGIGHILVSCIVVITAVCYDDCCFCTCITVMLGTQLPVFTARENECLLDTRAHGPCYPGIPGRSASRK